MPSKVPPPIRWCWTTPGFRFDSARIRPTQDNPFVLDRILDASHGNLGFQVSVWDALSGPDTDVSRILIAVDPVFFDLNGDRCNTLDDWQSLYESWRAEVNDPGGDDIVDVRDFLYLNVSGDCLTSKTIGRGP